MTDDEKWARMFHDLYEQSAPSFGYPTREDTKQFDPLSPNGKLMCFVCGTLIQSALAAQQTPLPAERDAARYRWLRDGINPATGLHRADLIYLQHLHGRALDEAIDAAIASQAGERDA